MGKQVAVEMVTGEIKTRNGVRASTLVEELQRKLQSFYDNPAIENIEVKPEVRWETAASGGSALLIITFDEKGKSKQGK